MDIQEGAEWFRNATKEQREGWKVGYEQGLKQAEQLLAERIKQLEHDRKQAMWLNEQTHKKHYAVLAEFSKLINQVEAFIDKRRKVPSTLKEQLRWAKGIVLMLREK